MYRTRVLSIMVLMVLLCVFWVQFGCSRDEAYAPTSEINYTTEWEDNEFTKLIVKPQHGEVNYVEHFANNQQYAIQIVDIDKSECEDYIRELEKIGYRTAAKEEDDFATGLLLLRDDAKLNIIFSDYSMKIIVTKK